ncbi:MAG: OPT/YSL family transporter [Gemmataceae bacterium]
MASEPPSPQEQPGFLADLFQSRYREATLGAILFGLFFGVVLNMAITYAGLKIGFTIGGSAIAAVLGFGVLRGLLRQGTILETNIAQTIASSVNIPNAGIIFTVPALILLGYAFSAEERSFWMLTLAGVVGAVLGVAFIIPLRKQMIDIERLRFPTAVAVAAILKSPGAGPKKSVVLVIGAVVAMLIYLPVELPNIKAMAKLEELDELVKTEKISKADAQLSRDIVGWQTDKTLPPDKIERGNELRGQIKAGKIKRSDLTRDDVMAITIARIHEGERDWPDLDLFRARKPLFPGYSDLNWRLGEQRDATNKLTREVDRDGNDAPDLVLTNSSFDAGRILGLPASMLFVLAITPLSFGAGYLTGRAGLMVLAGGILAFFVLTPIAYELHWMPATLEIHESPEYGRGAFNRPLGIGMLLGGALMGLLASLPAIRSALKSIITAGRTAAGSDELGFKVLLGALIVALVFLYVAADVVSGDNKAEGGLFEGLNSHLRSLLIALICAAWMWFAGIIIAQCTGMTDWSPISGMALLTVVLVMMLAGRDDVMGAVLIGAALCVAISSAADMMQDLKTGYLVGAQPKRQQVLELFTASLGPIICMATLLLIAEVNEKNYFKPIGPGTPTEAPQAQALAQVIKGVQGAEMPYALYGFGAVLGVLLGLGSFPGLGVLVGLSMYLPIDYVLTYGLGCVANMVVGAVKGRSWAEEWGVPFCAGLIVGEAILQMIINLTILVVS